MFKNLYPAQFTKACIVIICSFLMVTTAQAAACMDLPLRAMTYNIRLDTPVDGENGWKYRRAWVSAQVRLLAPDILGMQEVVLNQKRDLMADLPGYIFIGAGRDDGKEGGESSPVIFRSDRFKLLESGTFWLSPTPELPSKGWDAAYPRIVSWARLEYREGGRRVIAINTHWDHVGEEARLQSARLIQRWIEVKRQKAEFLVLLGDFNSASDSAPMQILTSSGGVVQLRDARSLSLTPPFGPSGSFNNFDLAAQNLLAIDHILVGDAIKVDSYSIVAQHVDGRLLSDHYPVVADLRLTGSVDGKKCLGGLTSGIEPPVHALGQQVSMPSEGNYPYLQFLPRAYGRDKKHKWPLLIFLHGSGERGADIERLKIYGPPKLIENNPDFPFVTISPLLEADGDWDLNKLDQLLKKGSQSLNIDPKRIYLTGLSRGGHATWRWAAARPDLFAAIAPVSGRGNVDTACKLTSLPVWAFHGANDEIVPPAGSSDMVRAINKCGGKARLDIYPLTGHDAWTRAYADAALFDWLLKQHLARKPMI